MSGRKYNYSDTMSALGVEITNPQHGVWTRRNNRGELVTITHRSWWKRVGNSYEYEDRLLHKYQQEGNHRNWNASIKLFNEAEESQETIICVLASFAFEPSHHSVRNKTESEPSKFGHWNGDIITAKVTAVDPHGFTFLMIERFNYFDKR